MRKQFDIKTNFGFIPGRETIVINKKGEIVFRYRSQMRAKDHVRLALEAVKKLD